MRFRLIGFHVSENIPYYPLSMGLEIPKSLDRFQKYFDAHGSLETVLPQKLLAGSGRSAIETHLQLRALKKEADRSGLAMVKAQLEDNIRRFDNRRSRKKD